MEKAVKKDDLIKVPEAPAASAGDAAAATTAVTSEESSKPRDATAAETGDTDSVVARQNQLNERQVQGRCTKTAHR